MNGLTMNRSAERFEGVVMRRLAPHRERLLHRSIDLLRISLGLVFLLFGLLKFVPGLSPAEELATETMSRLTFGLVPEGFGIAIVAGMETVIGLTLLTGRHLRIGLVLLGMAMIGVLSPLVLFTGELFSGPHKGPTLAAQYVFKDIVLLAAGVVVTVSTLGQVPAAPKTRAEKPERDANVAGPRPLTRHAGRTNPGLPRPVRSAA